MSVHLGCLAAIGSAQWLECDAYHDARRRNVFIAIAIDYLFIGWMLEVTHMTFHYLPAYLGKRPQKSYVLKQVSSPNQDFSMRDLLIIPPLWPHLIPQIGLFSVCGIFPGHRCFCLNVLLTTGFKGHSGRADIGFNRYETMHLSLSVSSRQTQFIRRLSLPNTWKIGLYATWTERGLINSEVGQRLKMAAAMYRLLHNHKIRKQPLDQ